MNQIELLTGILAREGAESLGWEQGRPGGAFARVLLRPAARRIAREFAACDEVFASRELIVAADYPFLRALRGLGPRLLFLDASRTQLGWIRKVSRDLRQGSVVLLFPAGGLEPDPAVLGFESALRSWSDSVGLIARLAPDAQIVPAAVTGVLSARAFAHPLTRLRRAPRDRQRVATLLQMIDPRCRAVTARIAFGSPLVAERGASLNTELAARMRDLLSDPSVVWKPLSRRPSDPATTAA